jgi:FlaA1/EpsC-like NDP-sugar epimerase/lipopolysaccharide/colanic/teichoic acid biosynthesis glycosyltransferase
LTWLGLSLIDAVLVNVAFLLAFALRFMDDGIPLHYQVGLLRHAPFITILVLTVMHAFGVNRAIWRYASTRTFVALALAITVSSALIALWNTVAYQQPFPRSVIALSWMTQIFLIGGSRIVWRLYKEQGLPWRRMRRRRVLIAGAGDAGEMLAREMNRKSGSAGRPIGFVDDDPLKQGTAVDRVRVLGTTFDIPRILQEKRIDEVIIAAPSAPARLVRGIVRCCQDASVKCRTLPDLAHFVQGADALLQVRDVALEDLLGRDPVAIDMGGVAEFLGGHTVLVTGAGGSIGSELCRQIASFHPAHMILVDHCENRLLFIQLELASRFKEASFECIVADIKDRNGMLRLFERVQPDVVFHAAAHKHVGFLENAPREAVLNNVMGTLNVAGAAEAAGARKFVFISTDKAVNPSSVMGATKRIGEMLVQCMARHGSTDFVSVRFGNVLGSDGSVVPIFRRQIAAGGPVTVTHPEARRYFMTIPEASRLVIQAGALGRAGQVYVLDMGEQVRIFDVARQMIRLSGLEPDKDIEVRFTGLRPGEKLAEELLTNDERTRVTAHKKIFVWEAGAPDESTLRAKVARLAEAAVAGHSEAIRSELMAIVPEYSPTQAVAAKPGAVVSAEGVAQAPAVALPLPVAQRMRGVVARPAWKRAFDVAAGGLLTVVAMPLMVAIALAKACTGARPILIKEERVGANRRRSDRRRTGEGMPIDRRQRERRGRLLPGRPISCLRFATAAADGVNRGAAGVVDQFLRRYRLDKLPLLFGVLRGEMSLVGPKPEKLSFVQGLDWADGEYAERFLVVPGVTGLAQAMRCPDHHEPGFLRRIGYDLYYVRHRSLMLDVKTLIRTVPVVFAGRGRKEPVQSVADRAVFSGSGSGHRRIEELSADFRR